MCGHTANECDTIKTLVKQAQTKNAKQSKEKKYTKHEINILVEKKIKECTQEKEEKVY